MSEVAGRNQSINPQELYASRALVIPVEHKQPSAGVIAEHAYMQSDLMMDISDWRSPMVM